MNDVLAFVLPNLLVAAGLWFAGQQVLLTRQGQASAREREAAIDEATSRPYVFVDFEFTRQTFVHIKIENLGRSPALNVKLDFSPDLRSTMDTAARRIADYNLWDGIPSLAPGQVVKVLLDIGGARFETRATPEPLPDAYRARVRYRSAIERTRTYEDHFDLDMSWKWGARKINDLEFHDLAKTMTLIEGHLEVLAGRGELREL